MKLSVLIPIYFYENADYLENCLSSIWTYQSRRPDEIVLVQDGPISQNLTCTVKKWKEQLGELLKIVVLPQNCGLGIALHVGLDACTNEFVARIDGDDFAHADRFKTQLAFMAHNPCVDVLGSATLLVDPNGNSIGIRNMPTSHEKIKQLIWACPVIHPSVLFRRSRIIEAGSYSKSVARRQEDYELWIRAVRNGLVFQNLNEPLTSYRVGTSKKNDLAVGWNRFKLGCSAVHEFDPTIRAWVGITYPLFRGIFPHYTQVWFDRFARRWDPR